MTDELERHDAGDFAMWRARLLQGLADGTGSPDVPCGTCTACCTSGLFVHIEPDETETLARIPKALRFPAPGRPPGHVVLGYDEWGHCPMFKDGACSIYEHRPRTCRNFDCRVLAAAGLEPEDEPRIAERVRLWRFSYATDDDRRAHDDVRRRAAAPATESPPRRAADRSLEALRHE
jgi:Fe-S-cluster containining protein